MLELVTTVRRSEFDRKGSMECYTLFYSTVHLFNIIKLVVISLICIGGDPLRQASEIQEALE